MFFVSAMMVHSATIMCLMAVFTQAICAPQVKARMDKIASTLTTPVNIPYDELLFILKVRSGEEATKPKTLSPCARAILGCCQKKIMNEQCSETLQCGAFFFDVNPCEDKFVIDALNAARAFYEQFNTVRR